MELRYLRGLWNDAEIGDLAAPRAALTTEQTPAVDAGKTEAFLP